MTVNKYTSFQVHQTDEIRQLLSWSRCIFSLTADTLHCTSKFGLPLYHHQWVCSSRFNRFCIPVFWRF